MTDDEKLDASDKEKVFSSEEKNNINNHKIQKDTMEDISRDLKDINTEDSPNNEDSDNENLNLKEEISLEEKINDLEKELKDAKDKTLRALADSENTRRQMEKNRIDLAKYGIQPLAREILSVLDNFSRALEINENEDENDEEALKKGLELTFKELKGILEKFNIKKINPLGKPFDPNLHQAMFEGESKDYKTGLVCQVIQEGYMFHDRLLRPAMVGISKNTSKQKDIDEN